MEILCLCLSLSLSLPLSLSPSLVHSTIRNTDGGSWLFIKSHTALNQTTSSKEGQGHPCWWLGQVVLTPLTIKPGHIMSILNVTDSAVLLGSNGVRRWCYFLNRINVWQHLLHSCTASPEWVSLPLKGQISSRSSSQMSMHYIFWFIYVYYKVSQ